MGSKGKPKFAAGDRVWSRMHGRIVTVRKVVWDADHKLWGYFFNRLPMYWLEYNLRPLTSREAGRGGRDGKR
jgi:hypothetical protein